ncbi:sensor histidine kinase [Erythrobacter sp. EC-HK427]|uniref:sensor histidine kinase n=1 Tax=Erythrobacter sp. EC-HK427 TaxID=2038396 RepID=UPI00125550B4|nr:histidine kinase dimerization/phospho-acceptor domain-containing protein [Erythrobacter sp. EC-HK427]VVT18790.1 conserved hypothetical protein [Erythrobacter sp. EC-HK427]
MQFDDRLATVLRMRADSEGGLRTQFRQLLDLLGTSPEGADADLLNRAYARLGELGDAIPQEEQSRILREGSLRLRDVRLVNFLATQDAKPAASAMATARLNEEEWLAIIPDLPVNSRGFLRHRRDLSPKVRDLLARLGVRDLVLPDSSGGARITAKDNAPREAPPLELSQEVEAETAPATGAQEEIGALLRRIAAFRETRGARPVAPRLPLDDEEPQAPVTSIEFRADAAGEVIWAEEPLAALLVGLRLTGARDTAIVHTQLQTRKAFADRQPVWTAPVTLALMTDLGGEWRIDAAPLFDPQTRAFAGYRGCLRRPILAEAEQTDSHGDRMRQVLHELRTPVNAIQGFAEIIQQQLFGPAPHEYRAHAAAIAVDAAKLLAGFDEVDRLVKLESGALTLSEGQSDMRQCVAETVERLQGVLRPRNAGFSLNVSGDAFAVGIERGEVMAMCWRLLASAAAALSPGEDAALVLTSKDGTITLEMDAPQSMREGAAAETPDTGRPRAVSAGAFGPAFAFKLAQAEAENAGGTLICKLNRITLALPALTASDGDSSAGSGRASG